MPSVFEDRTVSPTFIFDAARATRELLEHEAEPGLYHCVNSGHCTWLELATEAARQLSVPPRFHVLRLADLKLAAERPLLLRPLESQARLPRHPDAGMVGRAFNVHRLRRPDRRSGTVSVIAIATA